MRIGVFDSGVGGLTVLKSLHDAYPNNEYYYIGDNKHLPYGNKSKEELFKYASSIIDYFVSQNIKLIVIGCNTICSTIYQDLEKKYKDITFIGVIDATVDLFIKSKKKNVLVIGTENTIKVNKYETKIKNIDNSIHVYNLATPNLVPLIENDLDAKSEIENILKKYPNIDSIILGCTHYKLIENLIPNTITSIDSSTGVVNKIKKYIQDSKNCVKIYVTGNIEDFNKLCTKIMKIGCKKIDLKE